MAGRAFPTTIERSGARRCRSGRQRQADDQVNRSRRIGLRSCDPRHGRERGSTCSQMQERTARKFHGGQPLPDRYYSNFSARDRSRDFRSRHIASFRCGTDLVAPEGMADIGQARSNRVRLMRTRPKPIRLPLKPARPRNARGRGHQAAGRSAGDRRPTQNIYTRYAASPAKRAPCRHRRDAPAGTIRFRRQS